MGGGFLDRLIPLRYLVSYKKILAASNVFTIINMYAYTMTNNNKVKCKICTDIAKLIVTTVDSYSLIAMESFSARGWEDSET